LWDDPVVLKLCFIFGSPQGVYNQEPQHISEVDRRLLTASDPTASDSSYVRFELGGFLEGTKKRTIFFPYWTKSFPTDEECTHCHKPLFLAFRDPDRHPVLACQICGRLYLSKGTAKILTQIQKAFQTNSHRPFSVFEKPRKPRNVSQSASPAKNISQQGSNQLVLQQSKPNSLKSNGEEEKMEFKEKNSQWHSGSYFLAQQTGATDSNVKTKNVEKEELLFEELDSSIQNKELELEDSELGCQKKYQMKFHIDIAETRRQVLDVLDIVIEVIPNLCQCSQQGPTLTFQANSSVSKELVKTLLEIVGGLCNFNLTFKQPPIYDKLSSRDVEILLMALHRLGQKWVTTQPSPRSTEVPLHLDNLYALIQPSLIPFGNQESERSEVLKQLSSKTR